MTSKVLTIFINQARTVTPNFKDDWHDACSGHQELYEAITCSERSQAALDGSDQRENARFLHDLVELQLAPFGPDAHLEHRVVRRTITAVDEVVDGVGAELPTADVPTHGVQ
jgi:hypothetical protein